MKGMELYACRTFLLLTFHRNPIITYILYPLRSRILAVKLRNGHIYEFLHVLSIIGCGFVNTS